MSLSPGQVPQEDMVSVINRWQGGTTNDSLGFKQFSVENQNYKDLQNVLAKSPSNEQEGKHLNSIKTAWDKLIKINQLHQAFIAEFGKSNYSKASLEKFQEFAKLLEDYNLNDSKVITDINVNNIESSVGKFKQGISLQTSVIAGAMSPIGSYFKEISQSLLQAPESNEKAAFMQEVETRKKTIDGARLRSEIQKQEREFAKVQENFQKVSSVLGTKGLEIAKLAITDTKQDKKSLNNWKMTHVILEGQKELAAAQLAFMEAFKSDRGKGEFYSENTVQKYEHLFDLLVKFQNNYILYNKIAKFPPEIATLAGTEGISRWLNFSQTLMSQFPQLTKEMAMLTPGAWIGDKNGEPAIDHPLGNFYSVSSQKTKNYNDTLDTSADPDTAKTKLLKMYKQSVAPTQSAQKNEEIKAEKGDIAVTMTYVGDINEGRHNTKEFIRNSTQFIHPNLEVHENPQGIGDRMSKTSEFIIKEKGASGKPLFKISVDNDGVKVEAVGIENANDPRYVQQMNQIIKQLRMSPPKNAPQLQSTNIKAMIALMAQDVYTLDRDTVDVIRKDRKRIKADLKTDEHVVQIPKIDDHVKLVKQFQQAIDNGLIPRLVDLASDPKFQNQGALGLPLRINTDDAVIAIKQYEAALAAGMVIVLGDKSKEAIKKIASENPITISIAQHKNTGSEILTRIAQATEAGLLVNKVAPEEVMDVLKKHLMTSVAPILLKDQPDPYLAIENLIGLGIACIPKNEDILKKIQEKQGNPAKPFEIPETGNDKRNLELLKHYLLHGISVKVPNTEKLFASLDKSQVIIPLEKLPKEEQLKQVQALAVMGIDGRVSKGIVPPDMPIMVRSNDDVRAIKSFEGLLSQGFMPMFEKDTQENLAKNNSDLGVFINDPDPKKLLDKMQHCFIVGVKVNVLPDQMKKLKDYLTKSPTALPDKMIQIDGYNAVAIRDNLKLCQELGLKVNAAERAKFVLKSDTNRGENVIEVQDVYTRSNKKGGTTLDIEKTMEKAKNLAATGCKVSLTEGTKAYLEGLDRVNLKEDAGKRIFIFFKPQSAKDAQERLNELKHYDSFIALAKKEQPIPSTIGGGPDTSTSTPNNAVARPQVTTLYSRQTPELPLSSMGKQPFDKVKEEIIAEFKKLFESSSKGYSVMDSNTGINIKINKETVEIMQKLRTLQNPEEVSKYLKAISAEPGRAEQVKNLAQVQLQKLEQPTPISRPTLTGRH